MEQGRIFISYSRVDSEFALKLAKDLKAGNINIWIDQLDISTGARWDDALEKALEKCSVFLILLSPESSGSQNVKDEIGYAIDANKRILPVIVKPCTVPLRLRRFQYVDFAKKSYDESLNDIRMLIGSDKRGDLTFTQTAQTASTATASSVTSPKQAAITPTKVRPELPSKTIVAVISLGLVALAGIMVFLLGKNVSIVSAEDKAPVEAITSPSVPLSSQDFLDSRTKPFLYPTETLISEDGRYELALHADGNLVLKDRGNPIWASNTAGNDDVLYLHMQEDGNLVMYGQNLRVIWSSDTSAEIPAKEYVLLLQNDGNVVILTFDGEPVWALK